MKYLDHYDTEKINENFGQMEDWIEQFEEDTVLIDGKVLYTEDGLMFQAKEV